jgi:ATP-dependent Clp protease ATP-binding subunit ClpA
VASPPDVLALDAALDAAVERALASQFRPEFLNRIDEVIRFRPLAATDLERIVRLQLADLAALLAEQRLQLQVEDGVVACLALQGYEPEYGARPLRRLLRRSVENPLAIELLADHFSGAWGVRVSLADAAEGDPAARFRFTPLNGDGSDVR